MQQRILPRWRWQYTAAALLALLLIWQRMLVWRAVQQLFFGMLVALILLPLMKLLEKRLKLGLAASLAMTSLSLGLIAFLLLLAPPVISQGRLLLSMTPAVSARLGEWADAIQRWLESNGMPVNEELQASLLEKGQAALGGIAPAVISWAGGFADSLSLWLLAPLFAYYFLRDRKRIGDRLLMLVPAGKRELTVKALREMRRETASYLRGQLLVSCAVGGLTALGLMLCGVPAWLLLGLMMGILELIPYLGPFLGGVLVLLFSLSEGLSRTLWAMGVVLLVQQLEGGMLSPQLMSEATRLHPVIVLLCVMLGGSVGGVAGILLAIPLVLCARAALRVVCLHEARPQRPTKL